MPRSIPSNDFPQMPQSTALRRKSANLIFHPRPALFWLVLLLAYLATAPFSALAADEIDEAAEAAKEKLTEAGEILSEGLKDFGKDLQKAAEKTGEAARDIGEELGEATGEAVEKGKVAAKKAAKELESAAQWPAKIINEQEKAKELTTELATLRCKSKGLASESCLQTEEAKIHQDMEDSCGKLPLAIKVEKRYDNLKCRTSSLTWKVRKEKVLGIFGI